jgi:hypothetical protein
MIKKNVFFKNAIRVSENAGSDAEFESLKEVA